MSSQYVIDASGTYLIFYNFFFTGNIAAYSDLATKQSLHKQTRKCSLVALW